MPTGTKALPGPLSTAACALLLREIERRGLTQAAVGRGAGISETQTSRVLRGIKPVTLDEFDALCNVLGLDIVKVLGAAANSVRRDGLATVTHLHKPASKPALRRVAKPRSKDRGGDDGQG